MNKLSAIDLLGSHTFDHYKTSHGWKEKENKWGIKKYITDEDETFDSFEGIGNEALDPKSEWMDDLIEIDGVRDAIHTLAKKEKNERAIEVMEQYDTYFDGEEDDEEEVTVVAVKKRGKKKKEEKTDDDTETLEEKALSGDKKAMEELKQRMREEGAGEKAKAKTVKKKKSTVKKTTPKKATNKKGGTSSARGAAAKPSASEKKMTQPIFRMADLYVAEMYDTSKVNPDDRFMLEDLDVSGFKFEHIEAADSAEEE